MKCKQLFVPLCNLARPWQCADLDKSALNTYFWTSDRMTISNGGPKPRQTEKKKKKKLQGQSLCAASTGPAPSLFPLTVTTADGDTEHHEVENRPLVFALAEDDGSQLNSAVQQATPPAKPPHPTQPSPAHLTAKPCLHPWHHRCLPPPPPPSETEVTLQVRKEWQMEWMKNRKKEQKKGLHFLKREVNIISFLY